MLHIHLAVGLIALGLVWLADVAAASAAPIDEGRYHALVIGNNQYEHLERLQTAVSDAAAVAELLKLKYGFDVTLLLNATRGDILEAVNRLRAELTEKDRLLVYYAGHGEFDRQTQTGYWLPVDAEPENDTNWIANDSLTRHFSAMSARHVMVVADSCYSGALVRSGGAAPRTGSERGEWLRRMAEKRARTALVSGGLEPVADAGRNGHSVFANAFLDALRENEEIMEGGRLAQKVRERVVLNADQTPQYSNMRRASHEGGDFLFRPLGFAPRQPAASASSPARMAPDARTIELTYWDSVRDSDDPEVIGAYLSKYPDGEFAALAKARIASLQRSRNRQQAPRRQDQAPDPSKRPSAREETAMLPSVGAVAAVGKKPEGRWTAEGSSCFNGAMLFDIGIAVRDGRYEATLDAFVTERRGRIFGALPKSDWDEKRSGEVAATGPTRVRFGDGIEWPVLTVLVAFPDGAGGTPTVTGTAPDLAPGECRLEVSRQ